MTIKVATQVARKLAAGKFGYSQSDRWSGLGDGHLVEPGNFDCSSSTGAIYYLGGLIDRDVLRGTFYTGNLASKLVGTGQFTAIRVAGWSLAKLKEQARIGDAILGAGHVVYSLGGGLVVSFEADERGRSYGGKRGDQTGREGRIRELYARSRGWSYILRPIPAATFKGRILAAYSRDGVVPRALLKRLARVAPFDGPAWSAFMEAWAVWDTGMTIATDPAMLPVPQSGHAYVVLGSTRPKMRRRLRLALAGLQANPASRVLVTGGTPRATVSEAAYMRGWLVDRGVDPSRILLEDAAASTVGNAKYSLPMLLEAGLSSYTLVSDASHVRRAQVLFAAAQLGIETAGNKPAGLVPTVPLAYDDYTPDPVTTARPVAPAVRAEIVRQVAAVLDLTITT